MFIWNLNFNISVFIITVAVIVTPALILYTKSKRNTENDETNNKIAFFANNLLLYFLTIAIGRGVFDFYFWLSNSKCVDAFYKDLMGTGIFLPFVLWVLGLLIREIYKIILVIFNTVDVMEENEKGKEVIFSVSLLIIICFYLSNINGQGEELHRQLMFIFFILAVLIGRFIWLDTTSDKLIEGIRANWDNNKSSMLLGALVLVIMLCASFSHNLISANTALNILLGLLFSLLILIGIAIYDYQKGVSA